MNKVKKQQKNWLFLKISLFLLITLIPKSGNSQLANYISNGGFEAYYNCIPTSTIFPPKYWTWIDSTIFGNCDYANVCYPTVPYTPGGFQYPRNGGAMTEIQALCQPTYCASNNSRGYLRNRLKSNLQSGKTYCVKFYINVTNYSSYGIDGFGIYFGDSSIDTITKTNIPLIYLNPQVQNVNSNIISDTLNWSSITGTFVANGNEKYAVVGNFKSDIATTQTLINSFTSTLGVFSAFFLDDVSCIPIDLPAYAGPDVFCVPGNSVYIGRPSDVGIDEACTWYKMPNMATPIATIAGLWVSPVANSTYVVKQDICGYLKQDTVVVMMSGVGISEASLIKDHLSIYPIPAKDELNLSFDVDASDVFDQLSIYNSIGQLIREEELKFINHKAIIKTSDLSNGVYLLKLKGKNNIEVGKRFVIAR